MKKDKFDFKNVNDSQKQAIINTEGPLLISAGPGTGKTYTLVSRIIYLIQEKGALPENIFVATYTDKAAKELLTRISNELISRNINLDVNEMYVGTFHSLCLRIIRDHLEYSTLRKNFSVMDSFDQQYFIYQNLKWVFEKIENVDLLFSTNAVWKKSKELLLLFNGLTEELIDTNELYKSSDLTIKTLGKAKKRYDELLDERNRIDFSSIQTKCLDLLLANPKILRIYRNQFRYLMIDEYQDTNYIQEQLIFLLAGETKNICVVGDDDQSLYRFRGATIRNILEFPNKFKTNECKVVKLQDNYRSTPDIVDFYNKWIISTEGENFSFKWDNYRIPKKIEAIREKSTESSAVFKLSGEGSQEDWYKKVLSFLTEAKKSITDLNQIAFLFNSVKSKEAQGLAEFLEENGINVYSPRSDMFFEREEIKVVIGLLMLMFPKYGQNLEIKKYDKWIGKNLTEYFLEALKEAKNILISDKNIALWLRERIQEHMTMKKNTDYALSGLFYQMLQFEYFKDKLETDLSKGIANQRSIRNLSIISNLLAKFEYNENISVLTKEKIDRNIEQFFNNYIRFLIDGGIDEYQDESEYAPSGCVSFLTIHQSKGMEFPIAFVSSLGNIPRENGIELLEDTYKVYSQRKSFEPKNQVKFFDFWRLYYVAFSRAQDMLILTTEKKDGHGRKPSKYINNIYNDLIEYSPSLIDISSFTLNKIKSTSLKQSYAFTSDIALYEKCSLQYKMYRELGFSPVRVGSTLFGSLVHQTIEDVHKSILRGEESQITEENISTWFIDNYRSLAEAESSYLGEAQLEAAKEQILNYVVSNRDRFYQLKKAEVEVSLVQENYILNGQIDLVQGENGTVEIIDFKAEKKPDIHQDYSRFEQYKKQLEVYAYLLEQKEGFTVSKMHLYYTGATDENPKITFNKNNQVIEQTIAEFDNIVEDIQKKNFATLSEDLKLCSNCDMRFYCGRVRRKGK